MASLVVVLIISGCAAYLYKKGTLVKSVAMVIVAICASIVAFNYFELLANVFISRSGNSRYPSLLPWAQPLCFVVLFVLAFAILRTITAQLTRQPIDLGTWPERIGRVVCGIFLGLILSGILLTTLAMAPLPSKYPYQRFDQTNPDTEKPGKALFNADGFATGWFSMVSRGCFSSEKSFAILHPNFLDQVFLNRHNIADDISIIAGSNAVEIAGKNAVWYAPEGLKNAEKPNETIESESGHKLTIVRTGINRTLLKYSGTFTLSQLRLVCKQRNNGKLLAGKGKNIYPIGYLKTADQLQKKRLNDRIKLQPDDFSGRVKYINFAFYVPNDFLPVLVEFKQNSLAQLPPPVSAENLQDALRQAPSVVPFIRVSECAKDSAQLKTVDSAKVCGIELAAGDKFLADLTLKINGQKHWEVSQTDRSIKPAQFDNGKTSHVRAEMKIVEPPAPAKLTRKQQRKRRSPRDSLRRARRSRKDVEKGIGGMLEPLNGYKLLSLKCNNPPTRTKLKGKHLPVLVELSGIRHHCVGVIAAGKTGDGDESVYEVDYCSLTTEQIPQGLIIAEDGSVAQPFPDNVWLIERAQSISEFYVLYLVKAGTNAIITSVWSADSQVAAGFKKYEGFFIK